MSTVTPLLDVAQLPEAGPRKKINVLLVSSVALAFISFWRAAAIVLCDLASTAYYIGGISEQAIGKAAPWFILGVMLFSYAVRAVYVESCTMFTRGGVYKVVKEAMGGSLAKLSVSALMFDYILTGPISAVSAGQYLVGLGVDLLNLVLAHYQHPLISTGSDAVGHIVNAITVVLAIGITIWFWRVNLIGIHESSDQALRIMQLTTIMGVVVIAWSGLTLFFRHQPLAMPPMHPVFTDSGVKANESSKGWLEGLPHLVGTLGIMIAFGHTLLAMSGEESLAQVNREIEAPKLKNLLRAGFVIFLYSLLLTSVISFLAVFIIPDGARVKTQIVANGVQATDSNQGSAWVEVDYLRPADKTHAGDWGYLLNRSTDNATGALKLEVTKQEVLLDANHHVERDNGGYRDNLINGLVQYLYGPSWMKIILEIFVVIVGFLILAGAVNTSIVGSNGVMNRLAEDGVLTPWFLHPQPKYGTTHRLINIIVALQLITIVASWGDVDTLGEAYAFGVIWSFVFKSLAMVVLRFKDRSPRQYEVPLNLRLRVSGGKFSLAPSHTVAVKPQDVTKLSSVPDEAAPADGVAPKPSIPGETPNAVVSPEQERMIDLPLGIITIFLILLSTALINLVTKKTATIWGVGFTAAFLVVFIVLEQIAHRRNSGHRQHLEQFNEKTSPDVTVETVGLRHPKPVLVAARGPKSLPVLERVLKETNTDQRDVVVVTCKVLKPRTAGITPEETAIDDEDRELLTRIVTVAEEVGRQVYPVVIPTNNPLYGIACTARDLGATEVVLGVSEKVLAEEQLEQFALAWGSAVSDSSGSDDMTVRILGPQIEMNYSLA